MSAGTEVRTMPQGRGEQMEGRVSRDASRHLGVRCAESREQRRGLLDGYRRLGRGAFLTEWSGLAQLLEGLKARLRNSDEA